MWGDFNSGGLYGSLGVFDPNNHKGGNVDGAPPVATLGNIRQYSSKW